MIGPDAGTQNVPVARFLLLGSCRSWGLFTVAANNTIRPGCGRMFRPLVGEMARLVTWQLNIRPDDLRLGSQPMYHGTSKSGCNPLHALGRRLLCLFLHLMIDT